jgi:hypothetical protein
MSAASRTALARIHTRARAAARGAAGALLVALGALGLTALASLLAGRAPRVEFMVVHAVATAALAGGAVLGAMPGWVRRGTWRRGAAAAIALLVGVGVCEAQAALATPLLADGPEIALPLALALVAAPLFTRGAA